MSRFFATGSDSESESSSEEEQVVRPTVPVFSVSINLSSKYKNVNVIRIQTALTS